MAIAKDVMHRIMGGDNPGGPKPDENVVRSPLLPFVEVLISLHACIRAHVLLYACCTTHASFTFCHFSSHSLPARSRQGCCWQHKLLLIYFCNTLMKGNSIDVWEGFFFRVSFCPPDVSFTDLKLQGSRF
jgi:hypothetical protein